MSMTAAEEAREGTKPDGRSIQESLTRRSPAKAMRDIIPAMRMSSSFLAMTSFLLVLVQVITAPERDEGCTSLGSRQAKAQALLPSSSR